MVQRQDPKWGVWGARGRLAAGVLCASLLGSHVVLSTNPDAVNLNVLNDADVPVMLHWINAWSGNALVPQRTTSLSRASHMLINSYRTHSFMLLDEKYINTTSVYEPNKFDPKIMAVFTMGDYDEEITLRRNAKGEFELKKVTALTKTTDLIEAATEKCKQTCTNPADAAGGSAELPLLTDEFVKCMSSEMAPNIAEADKELKKNRRLLETVGDRVRNYTCADPLMTNTNNSLRNYVWYSTTDSEPRKVNVTVYLDDPEAKIMLLDNFVTEKECKFLTDKATPHLRAATVNGGDGESELSPSRRALASGVDANFNDEADASVGLFYRSYTFANEVTGYNMPFVGQESYSVIKYTSTDEYRPHCDGDCTGAEYRQGGRVASMVLFCEEAEVGGGTTFSSVDVFVKGKKGQAVFFSYLGPDNRTDTGKTRHSGCPIIKGTKWIATLWMRLGVTKKRDWTWYDPEGVPRKEPDGSYSVYEEDAGEPAEEHEEAEGVQHDMPEPPVETPIDGRVTLGSSETVTDKLEKLVDTLTQPRKDADAAASKAGIEAEKKGWLSGLFSS